MKLNYISFCCSLILASPVYVKAMEETHQDLTRIAALYERYKNIERALFQHRSRALPSPSDVNGQPPAYQSPRTPTETVIQRNQPQQLPHEQELPPTYSETLYQKNLETLLDSARKGKTQEAVQQMKYFKQIHQEKIVGTNPLREALIGRQLETFKYLTPFYNSEEEIAINRLTQENRCLLRTALLTKDLAAVKNFLAMSGDCPSTEHINQVIHFEEEHIELLKLLITHGAPVNITLQKSSLSISNGPGLPTSKMFYSYVTSPLLVAAAKAKPQTIVYLLQAGANPHRCYKGEVYCCFKEDARIDLLDKKVSTSPAIKQLIRDNQNRTCAIQ